MKLVYSRWRSFRPGERIARKIRAQTHVRAFNAKQEALERAWLKIYGHNVAIAQTSIDPYLRCVLNKLAYHIGSSTDEQSKTVASRRRRSGLPYRICVLQGSYETLVDRICHYDGLAALLRFNKIGIRGKERIERHLSPNNATFFYIKNSKSTPIALYS